MIGSKRVPFVFFVWITRGVLGLVALASLLFVARFWVNVPFADEWDIVPPTWTALKSGTLNLSGLLSQHNEHRPAVARLSYTALAAVSNWDTRVAMVVTQVFLLLSGLGCLALARGSIQRSGLRALLPMALVFLALFSPAQRENLVMGLQFMLYVPGLCLLAVLWQADRGMKPVWIVIGSAGLAFMASFSVVTGLLCWLLMPWAWPRMHRGDARAAWPWVLWIAAGAMTFWIYFADYEPPAYHPSVLAALQSPAAALDGLLLYLGSTFAVGQERAVTARWSGAVLAVLMIALGVWLFRNRRDAGLMRRAKPWIIMGLYGLGAGLFVLIGRIGFGAPWMLTSRYVGFSAWIVVACVVLVWLWTEQPRQAATRARGWSALALAAAFLVMYGLALPAIWPAAASHRLALLRAKAALVFADVSPAEDRGNDWLYPRWEHVRENVGRWRRAGIVRDGLSNVAWQGAGGCQSGTVTGVSRRGSVTAMEGWAYLPDQGRAADTVVVTRTREQPPHPVLAVAPSIESAASGHRGWWQLRVPRGLDPNDVQVWAYDATQNRAYALCVE